MEQIIVTVTAGVCLMLIGAIIWKFKLVGFFVRKKAGQQTDREGLAKWMGTNMLTMGIITIVFAAIQFRLFQTTYMLVDFIIIIILSTRMAMGMSKFNRPVGKSKKTKNKGKY